MSRYDRNRLIAALVLVIALVVLAIGVRRASQPAPPVIEGTIEAQQIDVGSKVAGRVAGVFVHVGDIVRAGAPLFTVDSPELRAALQSARGAALTAAGAERSANGLVGAARGLQTFARGSQQTANALEGRAKNGNRAETVAAARAQYESSVAVARLARTTFERTQHLYNVQVAPAQERDSALAALHSAEQQQRSAYEIYRAAARGSRPEDIAAAGGGSATAVGALQTAVAAELSALGQTTAAHGLADQALGAIALAQAQLSDTRVTAPAAGQITAVDINPGELAPQGYPVVSLIEAATPWATFNIPETLLPQFTEGTMLALRIPALNERIVRFRVYYVSVLGAFATERSARTTSGEDIRTFEVRARPLDRDAALRVGMSVVVAS